MATTIKLKNSVTTTNAPSSLVQGEVAINITDKKVWVGNAATTPIQLLGDGGSVNFTTVDTTNLQVTNIKAKDGTASASIANSTGAFTVAAAFAANGGATLGDASGDALTINSSAVSIPNGLNFDSNTFVIDAANNRVGIGTSSPSAKLDVSGGNIRAIGGSNALIGAYGANSTSPQIALGNAAGTNHWLFYETLGAAGEQGSVNIYDSPTGTNRLTITTAGNVGIGTSSPAYRLDVATSSGDSIVQIKIGTTTNDSMLVFGDSAANAVGRINYSHAGDAMLFYTSSTERMRITSGGDVGVGTTVPACRGDFRGTSGLGIKFQETSSGNSNRIELGTGSGIGYINADAGAGSIVLGLNVAGTERMRITSGGDVLVGTTSVSQSGVTSSISKNGGSGFNAINSNAGTATYSNFQLGNANSANRGGYALLGSAWTTAGIIRQDGVYAYANGAGGLTVATEVAQPLYFATNNTERMRIDSSGNVLIGGTASPASATKSLALFNGTVPTGSVTDGCVLYTEDVSSSSELKVRDEAGNVTTLSPHNFSMIPEGKSEDMAWAYYSERDGKRINVDMLKLARMVEKLTGEKLVYTN